MLAVAAEKRLTFDFLSVISDFHKRYTFSNHATIWSRLIGNFFNFLQVDKVLYRFLPVIVQAVSGAVCYYFARVACKLCMQGFGFSLPLTLITPATGAIFCYLCYLQQWTRITLPDMDIGKLCIILSSCFFFPTLQNDLI